VAGDEWYKDVVFYQIWPRSFADGNGDGIGDLYGVYEKLNYVKSLGVGGIWFSPLYVSPNADFGYDIADYRRISPDYGDEKIFRRVLDRAHELGLKVIMDLVINHTSIEHEWFRKGIDPASPYHDYYIWRDPAPDGGVSNNWQSMFGGPAWTYNEENGQYYLHLFSAGQPDLNMDNPRVRDEVKDVMRYWLDMGVDGFREDVITLISKAEGLPNDRGPLSLPKGRQYYDCGPHLADYLGEFRHDVLAQHDCFVVGEAPFVDVEKARMLTQGPRESRLLDMVFSFEHMEADCLFTEYIPLPFSPRRLMRALSRWQDGLHGVGWNALYLENHDHPRVISRYGSERYRRESGSMLACAYLFLEGTPFVYQGQEIGMTNISLPTIEDYPDCIAQANYRSYVGKMGEEKALARVRRATRDNARTPMQWDATPNAGFSTHEPWFAVNPNYREVNVAVQGNDENSLLNFYRRAIELRTKSAAVRWGEYHEFLRANGSVYAYSREFAGDDEYEAETLLVVCCFGKGGHRVGLPGKFRGRPHEVLLANYPVEDASADSFVARPYEARVYRVQ
jgi:oligo-1,6-glucosidase